MCTLNDIISEMKSNKSIKEILEILEKYNSDDWEEYESFSHLSYKKNLVYRDENYEMFVVCWKPRQETYIHNHSDNGCIFKVLEGELSEHKYNEETLNLLESNNLSKKSTGYIDNEIGVHKMINESQKENCISLHIYSPPNFVATLFKV